MIESLKPYSAYKASGMPWLGRIPKHWDVRRAKYFFREADDRSVTGDEELLSVSHITGVTPRSQKNITMFLAESNVGHKICQPGDIVINTMWAWMAALGVARQTGVVSPSYAVYRPISNNSILPQYADHLLRTPAYAAEYVCASTGINASRLRLYPEQFLRMSILRPPVDEQANIVRFVAHADSCIRSYINAKRKLVALLNEQKQGIIHRAVTRGLDGDVRLKPSSIESLGDIPEHWAVVRFGRLIHLATGFPFRSDRFSQSANDIRLLRGINVSPGRVRWDSVVYWPAGDIALFSPFELRSGDLVLGMDRPIVSGGVRVAEVSANDVPALLLQRVARIRPRADLDAKFALLLLGGKSFSDYLAPIFTGISVPHISPEQIGGFRVALPPKPEQLRIVRYLSEATANIEAAVDRAVKEISLFREYRARLVADVVTGKLDVREAAVQLPDVTPEAGLEDEDPLREDDNESGGTEFDEIEEEATT